MSSVSVAVVAWVLGAGAAAAERAPAVKVAERAKAAKDEDNNWRRWVVEPGDTLSAVASRFDVRVAELRLWNELTSDRLRVGQQLVIRQQERLTTPGPVYRVVRGDTLSEIAMRHGLSTDALLRLNPRAKPDEIRVGQRLAIAEVGREVMHTVAAGENLTVLAAVYETSIAQIVRVNRGLHPDRLRVGQKVRIFTQIPESRSQSVGTPSAGSLQDGIALRPHPGYLIRDKGRAYGTAEAVWSMGKAFDTLRARFPKAPRVEVHDLSLPTGGPITDHRSHQSGRDVDLAYFYKGCERDRCRFKRIRPAQLDVTRQWTLLRPWLENVLVEAIFIDYPLQRELYLEAKRSGATREQLQLWFQYPRGRTFSLGVIRHYPAHADHIHVRFACHESDPGCKTYRPLLMRAQHASR